MHERILDFWFGRAQDNDYGKPRKFWFIKNPDIDREIKSRFESTYRAAARGQLNHWQTSLLSCLALIIVLDQFPRNMYREHPLAFATDSQALKIARNAVEQNYDQQLLPVQRWFVYLPFEHSENLSHQETAVQLFASLEKNPDNQRSLEYARKHLQVIQRFGRFPHRNQILKRESTPEEVAFLQQPGSRF